MGDKFKPEKIKHFLNIENIKNLRDKIDPEFK